MPSWSFAEGYLCNTDNATEFRKIDGKYESTNFKSGDEYLLSTEEKFLREFVHEVPIHGPYEVNEPHFLCEAIHTAFNLHRENLWLMFYHKSFGYVWCTLDDNPRITIATFSKF